MDFCLLQGLDRWALMETGRHGELKRPWGWSLFSPITSSLEPLPRSTPLLQNPPHAPTGLSRSPLLSVTDGKLPTQVRALSTNDSSINRIRLFRPGTSLCLVASFVRHLYSVLAHSTPGLSLPLYQIQGQRCHAHSPQTLPIGCLWVSLPDHVDKSHNSLSLSNCPAAFESSKFRRTGSEALRGRLPTTSPTL